MKNIIQTLSLIGVLATGGSLFAHSEAFTPAFVDTLVTPYLAMQTALAGDDLKAAQTGANAFLEAIKLAPPAEDAQAEAADLSAPVTKVAQAKDIKTARAAFHVLTSDLMSMVKHVGVTDKQALYVAHCPMAFSGKGADWMQANKTIANPYYGAMMLRCGSVKRQIAGENESDHAEHSDHHH
jgi:Cu(I)/Ag(I) efflux system membrane fusion protein